MNTMIRNLNVEILKDIDETLKINVIFFTASWCGSCKMVYPVIESLAKEQLNNVDVYIVDVDQNQELLDEFQVFSIPTIVIRYNKKTYRKESGYRSLDLLNTYINEIKEQTLNK